MQFRHPCILGTANHVRGGSMSEVVLWVTSSTAARRRIPSHGRLFPPAPLVLVMKHMHMHVMRRRFSSDISWKCLVSGSHERQLVFFALKKKQSPTQPLRLLRHQIYWGEDVSMPAVWNRRDKVDWTEPRVQMRETVRLWNKEGGIHDGNFSCRLYIQYFNIRISLNICILFMF